MKSVELDYETDLRSAGEEQSSKSVSEPQSLTINALYFLKSNYLSLNRAWISSYSSWIVIFEGFLILSKTLWTPCSHIKDMLRCDWQPGSYMDLNQRTSTLLLGDSRRHPVPLLRLLLLLRLFLALAFLPLPDLLPGRELLHRRGVAGLLDGGGGRTRHIVVVWGQAEAEVEA